jgi:hypothetical protein
MMLPSALGKMKAGSLPPAFYGELEDFFSSVRPDFAISGRTSLLTVCRRLQKAKAEKISARRVKDAERMIRAICAAAEIRGIRFNETAARAAEAPAKRRTMRGELAGAGPAPAFVPKEILAERRRVADAAEKAGILPTDLDYRNTDMRTMAKRMELEK